MHFSVVDGAMAVSWAPVVLVPLLAYMLCWRCHLTGGGFMLVWELFVWLLLDVLLIEIGTGDDALIFSIILLFGFGVLLVCSQFCALRRNGSEVAERCARGSDAYSDLACPLSRAFLIFAVQTVLMDMYTGYIIFPILLKPDKSPILSAAMNSTGVSLVSTEEGKRSFIRDLIDSGLCCFLQAFIRLCITESFSLKIWTSLFGTRVRSVAPYKRIDERKSDADGVAVVGPEGLAYGELKVRFLMAFIANVIYKPVLLLTLIFPLVQTQGGPVFIRNVVAILFVVQLDSTSQRFGGAALADSTPLTSNSAEQGEHGRHHHHHQGAGSQVHPMEEFPKPPSTPIRSPAKSIGGDSWGSPEQSLISRPRRREDVSSPLQEHAYANGLSPASFPLEVPPLQHAKDARQLQALPPTTPSWPVEIPQHQALSHSDLAQAPAEIALLEARKQIVRNSSAGAGSSVPWQV